MGVIRIQEDTKNRLALMKGKSVDNKIEMMLDYFDSTGADPKKKIVNPVFEVEKQVERVVKILRNIENKKITPMLGLIEQIYNAKGENIMNNDLTFTDEEIKKIEQLGEDLKKKDSYIKKLEEKLLNKSDSKGEGFDSNKVNNDFEQVKNTITDLFDAKKTTNMDSNSFLINRNLFNNYYKKIINITNVYVR